MSREANYSERKEKRNTATKESEPLRTLREESNNLHNHLLLGSSEQQEIQLETEPHDPYFFYITQE